MPLLQRLCPGCRLARIVRGPYCPRCAKARDLVRGSPTARGYGYGYQKLRQAILERDGFTCRWCGGLAGTVDHLVPLARGGDSSEANLVASCVRCNSKRGGQRR